MLLRAIVLRLFVRVRLTILFAFSLFLLTSLLFSLELGDSLLLFGGGFLLGLLLVVVLVAALGSATLASSSCSEEGVDVDDVLQETPFGIGSGSDFTENLVLVGLVKHFESCHLVGLLSLKS